jgi:hypothetical protein
MGCVVEEFVAQFSGMTPGTPWLSASRCRGRHAFYRFTRAMARPVSFPASEAHCGVAPLRRGWSVRQLARAFA